MADAFSGLAKRLQTKLNRRANFAASILSISDDHTHLRAKLCTGSVIEVPVSLLKNIVHLGSADSENDHLEIVSADIDVSSDGGMLAMQLAHEVARLATLLGNVREQLSVASGTGVRYSSSESVNLTQDNLVKAAVPLDTPLPYSVIKLPFQGTAGSPYKLWFTAPPFQYLTDWSINLVHCILKQPPAVIVATPQGNPTLIFFWADAPPGTPLGATYNGEVDVFGVLVQETT
jgi:hypothetical protein